MPTIGILSLQGDYSAHSKILDKLNVCWKLIRLKSELDAVDGLIIPGGESTALLKLMAHLNFEKDLISFAATGRPIFGTCAGMILLSKNVEPKQKTLDLIDVDVKRNAYGRQINSFIDIGIANSAELGIDVLEMVFIRAPLITRVGKEIVVLAKHNDEPVLVRQNNIIVGSFHPELSDYLIVHKYFLGLV